LRGKRFTSCFVTDLNGTFTPRDGRWLLALQYFPERGERPEDFDEVRCRELVERGAGRTGIEMRLVDARPWEVSACVANRFATGRCFLAGDAAHLMPPTGAFGGNTGIHDAHNLAWKLALAVRGRAEPALLESYDTERRAVAERTLAQALARLASWFRDPRKRLPATEPLVDGYDVVLGQRYDRGAVIPEATRTDKEAPFENHRELSGRPGTRAPHVPLVGAIEGIETRQGPLSTIDLFDRDFVLLVRDDVSRDTGGRGESYVEGDRNRRWRDAVRVVSERSGIAVRYVDLGDPAEGLRIENGGRRNPFELEPGGAALVRPDGFVAWRTHEAADDPARRLEEALSGIGLRPLQTPET
jgi:hypothetical protein